MGKPAVTRVIALISAAIFIFWVVTTAVDWIAGSGMHSLNPSLTWDAYAGALLLFLLGFGMSVQVFVLAKRR